MNRFHDAAREGHLDLLRDSTRRDSNRPDDIGRTPTLWAAYEGNTDALRLLVSRGGDPDMCDYQGYTALHYAALSGHVNTVTFLVSYGCNIWAMTNDYRTAKDLAAENGHNECLAVLDEVIADQSAKNKKVVKKAKEKALSEADKRVKKMGKMQAEHDKWLEKEEKKQRQKPPGGRYAKGPAAGKRDGPSPVASMTHRGSGQGPTFSEITSANGTSGRSRSKSPLLRSSHTGDDTRSRSTAGSTRSSLSDRTADDIDEDAEEEEKTGRPDIREAGFWRPIDGSGIAKSVQSLPASQPGGGDDTLEEDLLADAATIEHDFRRGSAGKNLVPKPKASAPVRSSSTDQNSNDLDWDPDDLDNEEEGQSSTSDLEFFLSVHNLMDYLPVFTREEIDLEALMLLLDEDFMNLGLPLGPRRKLTDAISKRKNDIQKPGAMTDTQL